MGSADFALSGADASFELQIDYDSIEPEEAGFLWLVCYCSCVAYAFRAEFSLRMTRFDLQDFLSLLERLASGDAPEVVLKNTEDDFRLELKRRATGAVAVTGSLSPLYMRKLATMNFAFHSDIASIDTAVDSIESALKRIGRYSN